MGQDPVSKPKIESSKLLKTKNNQDDEKDHQLLACCRPLHLEKPVVKQSILHSSISRWLSLWQFLRQKGADYHPRTSFCFETSHQVHTAAYVQESLKGLSHEIFGPVFWAVWMYLGLNVNRLWFLNFNYALLILDN
jgi:hypothetical protein